MYISARPSTCKTARNTIFETGDQLFESKDYTKARPPLRLMITFDPKVNVRLLKSQENTAETLCHISYGVVDENNWVNIFTIVNVLHSTPGTKRS